MQSLNIKDYFINEPHEIYLKYMGDLSNLHSFRQKPMSAIVKEFVSSELYVKRMIIIQLLFKPDQYDNQYLAYLLYDMLSNDTNNTIDTAEQIQLFDSLPISTRQHFKDAMENTIKYTNELTNFDTNKIPLEQQICLLNISESVKEKAMQKLKEVKAKSEDSGSKARQYLDGLLKIPFNIYTKEPIMNIMGEIKNEYMNMIRVIDNTNVKESYTSIEILTSIKHYKQVICDAHSCNLEAIQTELIKCSKNTLLFYISDINSLMKMATIVNTTIVPTNKTKTNLIKYLVTIINTCADKNIIADKNIYHYFHYEV